MHKNKIKGSSAKHKVPHVLYKLAKAAKYPCTAAGLSEVGIYSPATKAVPVDADVSQLLTSLETFWRDEDIDGGVYPAEATILPGSCIKLWTYKTHVDIGYAVGSPWRDRKRR